MYKWPHCYGADPDAISKRVLGFLDDISALSDISLRPFEELCAQVPVETIRAVLQLMLTRAYQVTQDSGPWSSALGPHSAARLRA
jgi:hypothetical protein